MDNLLPLTSVVTEDLFREYEEKAEAIQDEVKALKNLLKECHSSGNKESTPSKNKVVNRNSLKPKPLSQRNLLLSSDQTKTISRKSLPSEKMPEDNPNSLGSYRLNDVLYKMKNKGLNECSERIDDYVNLRTNPDKRTELQKQRFLLALENKWEEDFKTFIIFDPDLGEDLLKGISVLGKHEPKPKNSVYELKKKVLNEPKGNTDDDFLEKAQKKIDLAVYKDLSSIDYDNLRSIENKSATIGLFKTVSSLKNIKNPKPGIVFKKELWQNIEAVDD